MLAFPISRLSMTIRQHGVRVARDIVHALLQVPCRQNANSACMALFLPGLMNTIMIYSDWGTRSNLP